MLEQERPANGRSEPLVQLVQRLRRVASQLAVPAEVTQTRTLTRTLRSFRLADNAKSNKNRQRAKLVTALVMP
jgi:hypothetical protein